MKFTANDILSAGHMEALGFDKVKALHCTGVSTDSRIVKTGDLFVAIRGEKYDGHNFVTKAVEAGAAALVVEKKWADSNSILLSSINVPRLIVVNTVLALGELARTHRRKFKIPFIVVGGSNGKTTTKDMIASVLSERYRVLSTNGNLNNPIGVPQTLFRLEKEHQIAVVEIGTNHFGEIEYLCGVIEPTHALITTVGREHLEFFGSVKGVAKAEGESFDWLRKHRKNVAVGFVNGDDARTLKQARGLKKSITYGFGKGTKAVQGTVAGVNQYACARLDVKARGKKGFSLELSLPGRHNALNALAATTVGLTFRVPAAKIQRAISSFTGTGKRMQMLKLGNITVLNDTYNSNPDSVLAALETLNAATVTGKKIAVLADMLELGESAKDEHMRVGKLAKAYGIEYLLTYGPLSKHTYDAATTRFKVHYDQKNILSEYLVELVASGDIILIKGSRGMKMEDVVTFLTERLKLTPVASDGSERAA